MAFCFSCSALHTINITTAPRLPFLGCSPASNPKFSKKMDPHFDHGWRQLRLNHFFPWFQLLSQAHHALYPSGLSYHPRPCYPPVKYPSSCLRLALFADPCHPCLLCHESLFSPLSPSFFLTLILNWVNPISL